MIIASQWWNHLLQYHTLVIFLGIKIHLLYNPLNFLWRFYWATEFLKTDVNQFFHCITWSSSANIAQLLRSLLTSYMTSKVTTIIFFHSFRTWHMSLPLYSSKSKRVIVVIIGGSQPDFIFAKALTFVSSETRLLSDLLFWWFNYTVGSGIHICRESLCRWFVDWPSSAAILSFSYFCIRNKCAFP